MLVLSICLSVEQVGQREEEDSQVSGAGTGTSLDLSCVMCSNYMIHARPEFLLLSLRVYLLLIALLTRVSYT